jgi:ribA/ribD-fused uncharacterized protein
MEPILGFFGPWRFLSNFHFVDVEWEGATYRTTEHAYQAAKFPDAGMRRLIQAVEKPREARRLGQSSGCKPDWDNLKYDVMWDLCAQKFSYPKLQAMLLESGDAYLEETNTWGDIYWGVCNGVGQNNLGKILMEIRSYLG